MQHQVPFGDEDYRISVQCLLPRGSGWGRGRGATKEVTCKVQPEERELGQAKGWSEVGHTVMGGTA